MQLEPDPWEDVAGEIPVGSVVSGKVRNIAAFGAFVELKEGVVRVVVDLPGNHQFAPAIRNEIVDKIEPLWDVSGVVVEFIE